MVEQSVALDAINPQVASRMTRNFERYKRFEPKRRTLMRAALEKVAATPGLSKETAEVGQALHRSARVMPDCPMTRAVIPA
jgi:aminopeptidase N